MKCSEFQEWILGEFEGGIPMVEKKLLAVHLESCDACRHFNEIQNELDLLLVQKLEKPGLPSSFKQEVLHQAQILSAKKEQSRRIWIAALSLDSLTCITLAIFVSLIWKVYAPDIHAQVSIFFVQIRMHWSQLVHWNLLYPLLSVAVLFWLLRQERPASGL